MRSQSKERLSTLDRSSLLDDSTTEYYVVCYSPCVIMPLRTVP